MALRADQATVPISFDEYPSGKLSKNENQIRLLTVLPGEKDDAVRCTLRSANIDAIGEANALSYAWGLPPSTKTIFVNDAPFIVRQNLFDALIYLRQPISEMVLWIDAVCINQSDIDERNHQVQQMADIYSRAGRVSVWLGVETEKTREAFSLLTDAYLNGPFNREELMGDPRWVPLKELCEKDYWKRVWIVQEICLASRVVVLCGKQQIPWKYISELRKARQHIWTQYLSSGERDFLRSRPCRIDQQKESRSKKGCILWTLLERFKDSMCQDVHDKVYGFLGLSTDCGNHGLTVDYSKSVAQIYREIIWFYYEKFKTDSSTHHAAQLMKLSEFLQSLFGDRLQSDEDNAIAELTHSDALRQQLANVRPTASTFVTISACNLMVIDSFPSSAEAKRYRASELVDFVDGKIPYSHLGDWRNLIESDLKSVNPINTSRAYAMDLHGYERQPRPFRKVERPSVFIAVATSDVPANSQNVVGIAPYGSQTGDVVLTFVDSHVALIMRDSTLGSDAISQDGNEYKNLRYSLVGRGAVFPSHTKSTLHVRSQLTADKTIETVMLTSLSLKPAELFPATVSIDLLTLQIVTKSNYNSPPPGFNKPTLELLPGNVASTDGETIYAHRLQKVVNDSELQKMQESPDLKRYALGPGYTAIINPGAIGYVIAALQILYMLKPFRVIVLRSEEDSNKPLLNALRKLFWDLHKSPLPANPLPLMKAFGWSSREINEPQDFFEFWRTFSERLERDLGAGSIDFLVGKIKTSNRATSYARVECFYHLSFSALPPLNRLEDSLAESYGGGDEELRSILLGLPQVLILQAKFFQYDLSTDRMGTYPGNFEYPSELDCARFSESTVTDTVYQLHGVVVVEDVKPMSRYLLYLRPRQEDQWVLFFKEMVTYAQRREVFEDNFRRDTTRNAPLRTPYILIYIQVSRLDDILG